MKSFITFFLMIMLVMLGRNVLAQELIQKSHHSSLMKELSQQLDYFKTLTITNATFTEKQFGVEKSLVCEDFWYNWRQDVFVPIPSVIAISHVEKQSLFTRIKAAAFFNRKHYFATGNKSADLEKYEKEFKYLWSKRRLLPSSFNLSPRRQAQLLYVLADSDTGYRQIVYVEIALDITFDGQLATPYQYSEGGVSINFYTLSQDGVLKLENSSHAVSLDPINASVHSGLFTVDGKTPVFWAIGESVNTWLNVSPIHDPYGNSVDCYINSR